MKKFYISAKSIITIVVTISALTAFGNEYPKLILNNTDELTVNSDETYKLPVSAGFLENAESEPVEVTIKWKVDPGYLGKIDHNYIFTAMHPGEGYLIAKYKNARDSVKIIVPGTHELEEENDVPRIEIIPHNVRIESSDSVELRAFYLNEYGEKEEAEFQWSLSNPELGEFPVENESKFFAGQPGEGFISTTSGELSATVKLKVTSPKKIPGYSNSKRITIVPGDTIVHLQPEGTLQYMAVLKNMKPGEDDMIWSVSDENVATIDPETGLLKLGDQTGITIVKVTIGKIAASSELLVVDPEADLTVNTITLHRVLPDGHELPPKTFREGESYKIGGLPFPLNILNAGMLHFPFGCIHENITLYMFIPEKYAQVDEENSEINFTDQVITGVKFSVIPEGSDVIAETYNFDTPVILSLVFKHGLLGSLQIDPEDLDVFFADNTGFVRADEKVEVDTIKNKIYANIEHFSTIVVRQKSGQTNINKFGETTYENLDIYPNPFNTSTRIKYHLSEDKQINLAVYNMFGHQVKILVDEFQSDGLHTATWNGTNESGARVPTGIYICRMLKNGKVSQVKRIVLNR